LLEKQLEALREQQELENEIEKNKAEKLKEEAESMKKMQELSKNNAILEYNRLLRSGASKEDLKNQLSKVRASGLESVLTPNIGGGQADDRMQPYITKSLNMSMTNNVSSGMDLAILQNIIRQTVRQEFA
jgi:hypothetical protein